MINLHQIWLCLYATVGRGLYYSYR